jgi:hypothetical protein
MLLAVCGQAQEIWRIGEFDRDYDEFACARNYPAFPQTFPQDVVFRIGVSQTKRDWSFVHPGPTDYWAGSRTHPFTIEFELAKAPDTPLRLRIALVDVQGAQPTALALKIGDTTGTFRLRNGGGDASLTDPAKGQPQEVSAQLPAAMFHAGLNRIVIWSTGSWFLYDAISLAAEPVVGKPRVRSLALEPTVLFKRMAGGGLGQVVLARMELEGPAEAPRLTVEAAGRKVETGAQGLPVFGQVEQEVLVPEVKAPTQVTATATVGESSARAVATVKPERHWRIFMAASSHTDIGYTDLQAKVAERHNDNTDRAVKLCEKFPAFAWNLEAAWQADEYARARTPEQCERLYALARAGRIGIQASYLNMLTGLCSHEELNRWLYYAALLKRKHGVPMESALTSDVPTQTWGLPTTLAAAGVRYFAVGINGYRGYGFTKLMSLFPYWWEGPDGSRVLAYFAPGYGQAGGPLRTIEELRNWVLVTTKNQANFPYDALFLYGAFADNCPLEESIAATAQQWADRYEYPKVIVGTNAEYFRYMEKTYGGKLPVVRGDGGAYWEDGAAASAFETAANRRAHETASAADALWATARWAGKVTAPRTGLYAMWRNILLYDEHTWGSWNSVSEPDSPFTTAQWTVKARFATDADSDSRHLMGDGLQELMALVRTEGPGLLIFNATSWDREGAVVEAELPAGKAPADPVTRRAMPAADTGGEGARHKVLFRPPKVPAWGYVVCPLVDGKVGEAKTVEAAAPATIENDGLRLTVDPVTGGVASLVDKRTGREIVDQAAPYKLNEYLYVSGGDGTNIVDVGANKAADLTVHRAAAAKIQRTVYPGLGERLVVTGAAEKTPWLSSSYTLWDGCARLDINNYLTRTPERKKEAAYFAFPFAATQPEIRLEIPNGVMRPEVDQLPGACKEWYAVQHFARVGGKEGTLAWVSLDAPLVCIGDINRGRWPEKLEIRNGWLFSYVMNNYWPTNYKADQGGHFEFRYSVTARAASDAEAARFGWQAAMPLQCRVIEKAQKGRLPAAGSFCRVAPEGVMITAVKAAEEGPGVVVRLLSLERKPVVARLTVGLQGLRSAKLCNLIEEPVGELKMSSATVSVPVRPMAPTTVLLR